jgi:hypothetical protein
MSTVVIMAADHAHEQSEQQEPSPAGLDQVTV